MNLCRFRVKFVMHSDDKIERLRLGCSRSRGFLARSDNCAPLTPDYTICDFQSGAKLVFSLHDSRVKFCTRTRISFWMKTGMNLLRNDLYRNEISFPYHVNKHIMTYGDGKNWAQNESHPDIMWLAPKRQKSALTVHTSKFCATICICRLYLKVL